MELELKHLAPYLPYGLKWQVGNIENGIFEMRDLGMQFIYLFGDEDEPLIREFDDLSIKPILRPLSDLTKDIECNGEKFIPLKKLHEYQETNFFYGSDKDHIKLQFMDNVISVKHNKYKYNLGEDFILKYNVKTSNMGTLIHSFTYSPDLRRFLLRDDTRSIPLGVGFQLDMFNLLHEWHFDTKGLIEKGLGIDINTL